MADSPAIETQGLRKEFDQKVAVADLSLRVERGEVFGFLGPNGAGKTTAVKMLLGLVQPTAGDGQLLGEPLGFPQARVRIGFLPEHFRFHGWLTAPEFLKLHADLYGMTGERAAAQVDDLLELVGLAPHRSKRLRQYSKGMLQRIGLAQALLNDPLLVILDEPTSGLDPLGRRLVRDIIHDLSDLGTAVFINSHLLSEIEVTCHRVAFIRQGRVVKTVRLSELDDLMMLELRAGNLTPEIITGLDRFSQKIQVNGETITLSLSHAEQIPEVNRYLVERGADVYALKPERHSLEDVFVEIMSGSDE